MIWRQKNSMSSLPMEKLWSEKSKRILDPKNGSEHFDIRQF